MRRGKLMTLNVDLLGDFCATQHVTRADWNRTEAGANRYVFMPTASILNSEPERHFSLDKRGSLLLRLILRPHIHVPHPCNENLFLNLLIDIRVY